MKARLPSLSSNTRILESDSDKGGRLSWRPLSISELLLRVVVKLAPAAGGSQKKAARALRRTAFSCDCRPGTAPVPPHLCLMLMQLG
jgi:hypothetical protein